MYGGDEMGISPEGRVNSVTAFTSTFRVQKRIFQVQTSEKATFWVTVFFWTRFDGKQLPLVVIHQGTKLTQAMLHTLFSGPLPSDWIIDVSPSGYNDEIGFEKCISQIDADKEEDGVACTLLDGHWSHFSAPAWRKARKKKIFGFFLKAQDSTGDQVGDNGANSLMTACYNRSRARVHRKLGGIMQMNHLFFGEVMKETVFEAGKLMEDVILNGARRCGWKYELNDEGKMALLGTRAENYTGYGVFSSPYTPDCTTSLSSQVHFVFQSLFWFTFCTT